ncbi:GP46 family protein [Pandoraea eparura]|uniref:GP46 family protein n=1 Tax=Pandoraea eparura TaxID=2508291 RepID=A0A5E4SKJ6_9BURK|nr:phage GP46 family protein [Pandoraea eparura]VVD76170.1 GP46 family protein [Pandoraea eparura]
MIDLTEDQRVAVLTRAVYISLFSWRRALDSDPVDDDELQGWWGDTFPSVSGDQIGSRLWLLRRRTLTADTVRDAITYAQEALAWLVDDEHATAVDIRAERRGNDQLRMRVRIDLVDGDPLSLDIEDIWRVINAV